MNITDVVMKSRNVESFNNLLPVTSVTSEKSKAVASRNGYMARIFNLLCVPYA